MNRTCKGFLWIAALCALTGCGKTDRLEEEIAKIEVELKVKRFDRDFANSSPEELPELKAAYPYLFPMQFSDSIWTQKMRDTLQQEISAEVEKAFPDLEETVAELRSLFQHICYYFPGFRPPEIVTVISDVDYRNRMIYADSLLLISLDTYLGESHYFYENLPGYLKKDLTRDRIAVDAALEIVKRKIPYPQSRTFLAQMVFYGKLLYVTDLLLPFKTDAEKIGYTAEEWAWAGNNEAEIWRYFVERNLLFSTNPTLRERFTAPAPFSKFYLDLDKESPGQLGRYLGWKIVRAYMKNNTVSLPQLLSIAAEDIFTASRFKPEK